MCLQFAPWYNIIAFKCVFYAACHRCGKLSNSNDIKKQTTWVRVSLAQNKYRWSL